MQIHQDQANNTQPNTLVQLLTFLIKNNHPLTRTKLLFLQFGGWCVIEQHYLPTVEVVVHSVKCCYEEQFCNAHTPNIQTTNTYVPTAYSVLAWQHGSLPLQVCDLSQHRQNGTLGLTYKLWKIFSSTVKGWIACVYSSTFVFCQNILHLASWKFRCHNQDLWRVWITSWQVYPTEFDLCRLKCEHAHRACVNLVPGTTNKRFSTLALLCCANLWTRWQNTQYALL